MPLIGHIRVAGAPLHDEPDNGELNYDYLFSLIETHAYDALSSSSSSKICNTSSVEAG